MNWSLFFTSSGKFIGSVIWAQWTMNWSLFFTLWKTYWIQWSGPSEQWTGHCFSPLVENLLDQWSGPSEQWTGHCFSPLVENLLDQWSGPSDQWTGHCFSPLVENLLDSVIWAQWTMNWSDLNKASKTKTQNLLPMCWSWWQEDYFQEWSFALHTTLAKGWHQTNCIPVSGEASICLIAGVWKSDPLYCRWSNKHEFMLPLNCVKVSPMVIGQWIHMPREESLFLLWPTTSSRNSTK